MAGGEHKGSSAGTRRDDGFAKSRRCTWRISSSKSTLMRTLLFLATLAIIIGPAFAQKTKKEFKLYAQFIADTRVELSDGAMWLMDKGDTFPVVAYKNMQKNIVLQLAGATFTTDTIRVRILHDEEVEAGLEAYRKNVGGYLEARSRQH